MSEEDSPPPPPTSESIPPDPVGRESYRRRLEGVIPDLFKRAVELGVEKASEAPDNVKHFVGDLKLPKEIAHYLLAQIDETKNGLFRVVAKEMRDFLEHTNFAGEVKKLLTTVQFEVNTTIRFTPNNGNSNESRTKSEGDQASSPPSENEGDEAAAPSTSLPKPEVKTSLHVRRDGDEERERADRADRAARRSSKPSP